MVRAIRTIIIAVLIFGFSSGYAFAALQIGKNGLTVNGFIENDFGLKLGHDITKRDEFNFFEQRLQLKTKTYPEWNSLLEQWMAKIEAKADFSIDEYYNGRTNADLRVLSLGLAPADWLDLKIGRQVFTWGTGDYLFINDLFPKDYVSFYIGREDEYLKKPNDGIKVSFYADTLNADFILIPVFEPNTVFDGQRLSFFDSFQGGIAGINSDRHIIGPAKNPENAEYALRFYRNFESYETALYVFRGNYPSPRGYLNEMNRELFYPRLDVYGLSIRGPGLGGIVNAETGYYNSRQDEAGDNRLIENPMFKFLIGYSKDLGNDLSLGLQYLFEQTLEYDNYSKALLPADFVWDQYRHLNTLRLTKLYKSQTLRANLFIYFSPSDLDGYVRPSLDYDISDVLKLTFGANLPWGEDVYTEFGQTEHNKNIYTRLRYSF
ncbi:MAG: hypothetical protein KKD05_01365 [Candidatus Omnitrophica bacterium]|nr:hypothetical protein [Candidatus Omnitrophota bacterium]